MKKAIVLMIVLLSAAGFAFAGAQTEAASEEGLVVSPPGVFPIVNTPVTLTIFGIQDPRVEDLETNWYTQYLEELTNVKLDWEVVPSAGMSEKLPLLITSGDWPDIFFDPGFSKADEMRYGKQGIFLPLNDLIEKHSVNIKKIFADKPGTREAVTAPDGNIYSFFYINECYHCSMSMKMWINRVWLDKLNLAMPTTTDEFYKVLKAFKEKDPNGNGKADEIPMSGSIPNWYTYPYDFLMNAFIYNDGGNRLVWKNGIADFAANKEQWREGLRFVKKLFDEGLLDPAAFTQDQEQLKQLGENPDAVILGATGGGYPGSFSQRNAPSRREELYAAVPSLLGPAGNRITPYYVQAPGTGQMMISAKTQYPAVAFKWGDLRMTYEESLLLNYGKKDVNWRWGKPGEVGINGKPAVWSWDEPLQNPQNVTWYLYGPFLYDADWRLGQATEANVDMYKGENMNLRLYVETHDKYAPYQAKEEYTPPLWVTPDVADELAQLGTTIRDYVVESAARFIVGDLDIDSSWDSYVREFDKMGLARFLSIYQTLYDGQY